LGLGPNNVYVLFGPIAMIVGVVGVYCWGRCDWFSLNSKIM